MLKDIIKSDVVSKAADQIEGEAEQNPQKKENKLVRFLITLLWFVIAVGVDMLAVFVFDSPIIGAIIELVFGIVTFCVPYLRKKGSLTRWFGILGLISAVGLAALAFGL